MYIDQCTRTGYTTQTTVTTTDVYTLTNGWSVGVDLKIGDPKLGGEVTTKFAYTGSYAHAHTDTAVGPVDRFRVFML